ncbi:MAG TPA: PAS domain-containing protein, partial [Flavisolibacter sp.]|nr:PAS domain-containing protein [Flavisolibacter sp.]
MYTREQFDSIAEWMKWQSETLQLVAEGTALKVVLERIIERLESTLPENTVAAIFCPDENVTHLSLCAGRSFDSDFNRLQIPVPITAEMKGAGASAFAKRQVARDYIERVRTESGEEGPDADLSDSSCISTPLLNSNGVLRGTLDVCCPGNWVASVSAQQAIAFAAHTALLAIELNYADEVKLRDSSRQSLLAHNLQESEQRFQNLVREASVGIIVLSGPEMVVEVVNDMYASLIGRTTEQLLFKQLFEIIPETEALFRPMLGDVLRTGAPLNLYDQPYSVKSGVGDIAGFLNIVYQPYKEFDGRVTGVMVLCQDVTELVHSRRRLEESEAHFRNLVMQAPVAIAVFRGKDFIVDVANDCYLEVVGKTSEEFIGRPLFEALPETKPALEPIAVSLLQHGEARAFDEFEIELRRKGVVEKCYFNSVWKPYFDFHGNIDGFMIVAHEVTTQVEALRQKEKNERDIKAIIESAPFPIGVYVGPEMRIQFANRSIMEAWGKGSDVVGKCYREVLPELGAQNIYEQLDEVFRSGQPYHAFNQRVDLVVDGQLQPYYFNYSFTPLFDADGSVYGVMNTAADVTELARAYHKLEESEERAMLAIEASEQGTFHINLKTNELLASPRMAEIFDVGDATDRSRYISAIHPDDLPLREAGYATAYQTGKLDYEGRLVKRDGFVTWVRVKGKIYFDEHNEPHRLVGIVQDITEQKGFSETLARKVEERTAELEEANLQLVAINDELQQFAYVSSHDLQEPLRKIRIFSDILSRLVDKEGEAATYLTKITSSAERMTGLIRGLLEYSKVANAQVRFEKVNLNDLLSLILVDYELLILQKEARIHIDPLPEVDGVLLQMNQLFFNLIGNALKFTKRGIQPV